MNEKLNRLEELQENLNIEKQSIENARISILESSKNIGELNDISKIVKLAKDIILDEKFIKEKEKNVKAITKEIAQLEKEVKSEMATKEIKDNKGLSAIDEFLSEWKEKKIKSVNVNLLSVKEQSDFIESLEGEVERKKTFFLATVLEKSGDIVAADLLMGKDGNINGTVLGTKGRVTVQTIYAEGAVQRLHFRVLVK